MTVFVLASSGATSRHEMCDCGAPCSSRIGGPDPPCTTLISAPVVLTRVDWKPGKKRSVLPGAAAAVWAEAGAGEVANA